MKLECTNCKQTTSINDGVIKELGIGKKDLVKIFVCKACRQKIIERDNLEAYFHSDGDDFNWDTISGLVLLPLDFIEKYKNKVNWFFISWRQRLPLDFIEKYKDRVNWSAVCIGQVLPMSFIEKHKDKVDWDVISMDHPLSEEFIERHANRVNWTHISRYQKLSPEFVIKHIDKIRRTIIMNPHYKDYPDSLKLLLRLKEKEV
jgi:hypothetical protein